MFTTASHCIVDILSIHYLKLSGYSTYPLLTQGFSWTTKKGKKWNSKATFISQIPFRPQKVSRVSVIVWSSHWTLCNVEVVVEVQISFMLLIELKHTINYWFSYASMQYFALDKVHIFRVVEYICVQFKIYLEKSKNCPRCKQWSSRIKFSTSELCLHLLSCQALPLASSTAKRKIYDHWTGM